MSLGSSLRCGAVCLRNCVVSAPLIQARSLKQTHHAKLLCHGCYFEVDHRTDNKFVLCKVNPAHKQQQKNNIDFRLKEKYYRLGLQDLGADSSYVNARTYDQGYFRKDSVKVLKNDHKFDGLKALSKKATELSSENYEKLDS
ncbi:hypothetical protein ACHWQZ_G017550 [Mnemiopsis leidyi]